MKSPLRYRLRPQPECATLRFSCEGYMRLDRVGRRTTICILIIVAIAIAYAIVKST